MVWRFRFLHPPQRSADPRQLGGGRATRDFKHQLIRFGAGHCGDLSHLVERQLTGGERRGDQGQVLESLADPEQLFAGVGIEPHRDREPVLEGADAAVAPATELVELGGGEGHARHRSMGLGGEVSEAVLELPCATWFSMLTEP